MKNLISVLFILLLTHVANGQSYTVESVPNTKLINNGYVSNPDKILSDGAVTQINTLLDSLEKKTSAQVAVVMLNSIGDADVFDFAQSLFVKWGIGKSGNDNGLLILYVQDKRTVRFHTGFGLEGVLPDAICKHIQTQKMVPFFKEGNTDAGMIAGVEEVIKILTGDSQTDELTTTQEADISTLSAFSILAALAWLVAGPIYYFTQRKSFANSKGFIEEGPHSTMKKGNWWLWYYVLPIVVLLVATYVPNQLVGYGSIYGLLLLLATGKYNRMMQSAKRWTEKGEYNVVYSFLEKNRGVLGMAVLFPIPFLFLISHYRKKKKWARQHPRACKNCGEQINEPMSEATEDEFLIPQFILEESLKSVDYDVWRCNKCEHLEYEVYLNPRTKYAACPKCQAIALHTISSSTIKSATTSSTGLLEIVKMCEYCRKKTVETETIPVVSTSSDSSSSSSSSSGGSWGGGDSGGGGASSSW